MMKKTILSLLFVAAYICLQAQTARSVVGNMLTAIDNANTLTFTMVTKERFGKTYENAKMDIRMQVEPHRVYMKQYYPNEGVEILWKKGENNGKALVNPNGFPYINVSLSPYGSRMRKGNHHVLTDTGFKHLAGIIKHGVEAAGEQFEQHFILDGTVNKGGKTCYKLIMTMPDFTYESYTLRKDEYLVDIARRKYISEHMIAEVNDISLYDKVRAGTTLKVPNFYAKKTVFYIDQTTMFPVTQEIYDDKGLYEEYIFSNLVLNPTFSSNEFTEDCKLYGF